MPTERLLRLVAPLLLALLAGALPAAQAAPAWITIGDSAYRLLRQQQPQLTSRSSVLAGGSERVHLLQVDDALLPALSQAVHEQLRRCGGFVRHDSLADGLAALRELQSPPAAEATVPSYAIDNQALVTPLLAQLQDSRILGTIQSLSDFQNRIASSSYGVAASDWIYQQWQALAAGRSDVQVQQIRHVGWPQKSVRLRIAGRSQASQTVLLGAHLDSIASGSPETARAPGADDDASGVAALTEVIRVLLAGGYRPERSIEFIAYAAEEEGLRGSQQIAAMYKRQKRDVVGVMQLDMTAYQGDPTDIWIYTDYTHAAQNQFLANLVATYLPQLTVGYDQCGYACSDHASWTGKGYAASLPFEASDAHYNPKIHTPNDTTAIFGNQALHALKFTQLALAYAVELGSDGAAARGR